MSSVLSLRPVATSSSSAVIESPPSSSRVTSPFAARTRARLGVQANVHAGLAQRLGHLLAGEALLAGDQARPALDSVT